MRLIGLCGPIGCGKTTSARYLEEAHGYARVPFAAPLKAMLAAAGLTEAHLNGSLKELPCDLLLGRTPRYAMQTLGTEWGRDLIGPGLWLRLWEARVSAHGAVVADDVRFANEAARIRSRRGILVRVCRPGYGPSGGHASRARRPPGEQGATCTLSGPALRPAP